MHCIHIYLHIYIYMYIYALVYLYISIFIHVHNPIHICMHLYSHIYISSYIYSYIHVYITHTQPCMAAHCHAGSVTNEYNTIHTETLLHNPAHTPHIILHTTQPLYILHNTYLSIYTV